MDENIYLVRQYFENYVNKYDIEIDTNICDMLMGIMYEECIWDSDFDSFYEFMVENLV